MRTLKPLKPEVQAAIVEGQQQYKVKGMERSAVTVPNAVVAMQFNRTERGTEQIARASEDLSRLTERLQVLVSRCKLPPAES